MNNHVIMQKQEALIREKLWDALLLYKMWVTI